MKTILSAPHVTGLKQVLKALKARELCRVYLASDCDEPLKTAVFQAAAEAQVPVAHGGTMQELGEAAAIEVGAAVIGLLKAP